MKSNKDSVLSHKATSYVQTYWKIIFRILIGFGCPVDLQDEKGYTPLFHAVKYGSLPVVIALVENGANVNHISEGKQKTPLFRARSYEIVKFLIQKNAAPILKDHENHRINAIKFLMEHNPDAARAVFDSYLDIDQQSNLIMDFSLFYCKNEGSYPEDKGTITKRQMSLLDKAKSRSKISSIEDVSYNKMIILHPLLQIYLNFKFRTISFLFWIMLLLQAIIVATLTIIGIVFVQFNTCREIKNNATCFKWKALDNDICDIMDNGDISSIYPDFADTGLKCKDNMIISTTDEFVMDTICKIYYGDKDMTIQSCWTTHWLTLVTMFVLAILFLKELCEFLAKPKDLKLKYFKSLENILEIIILILACSFLILSHYDIGWANHALAWMVFLVWIDFVLYIGRFSLMGKYIFMSLHVMRILLLCLLSYLPVFCAFTFGYYILLQCNEHFNGYFRGFLSVFAMAVDELSYEQFDFKYLQKNGGLNGSTQVMTVFFMIFVSLILMNLLTAVTIHNTEVLGDHSKMQISNRKIDQLNEVIELRSWNFFNNLYEIIIKTSSTVVGPNRLPTLNMGNPLFLGLEENKLKMVESFSREFEHLFYPPHNYCHSD